ncbi:MULTISPECIES: bifunctional tRNA (5-methylaminomethyl-2-thiouridine)(34)-methyltransferase MnmD/FAD-dependent 5-carboxymethylaminomethyl-2-thiouridine(34) oxidoreductase MnmC [unclassified Campylobacter]|uniref:bifunctional tRNA (5-methylaminomethyl-2-thiouridine)(34)-methyltransferase MnmD/FAD-dependent 5-carboxymethylaminomethyl-2-thiouridine(34) oxidoreductase MnmC n=1 Tax=unclassified Campylobacter TaxID=2593542 RepID=UPI003D35022D
MKKPRLSFKGDTAYSEDFDDIYFNTDGARAESEYVFASAVDEIWDNQDIFIVAELGFGAGLNFLNLCQKFKNSHKKLHFVSIEAFLMDAKDMVEIYAKLGTLKRDATRLSKLLPPRVSGIHRINFTSNITLDLCLGDASLMLKELDFQADVWFLDGFAPSKNETMWSIEIFNHIARLSRVKAIARTYSCAKIVRENFALSGFLLELRKGYAKKRQMSHAVLNEKSKLIKEPYFSRPKPSNGKNVLIIGAGVAGCVSAFMLSALGFKTTIAEMHEELATNGSGNHCGILVPLLTKPDVNLGRMHINAFLQAVNFYKNTMSKKEIEFNGAWEFAFDDTLKSRYFLHKGVNDEIFSFDMMARPYPAVFIKDGATARPKKMCKIAARGQNILFKHRYISHKHLKNGKISVKFDKQKSVQTDILIFATGSHSVQIFKNLPISSVRGQVTHVDEILDISAALSAKGYITPAKDGIQVAGATYSRNEIYDLPRDGDDAENLEKISEFLSQDLSQKIQKNDLSKVEILGSRVGYRSYSSDRFPIIGALHDEAAYMRDFGDLFWSKKKPSALRASYEPNVFVNFAHGSRGLGTAVLGATLLCDLITGRPLCIEKSLFNELHSARFLVRKLKKGIKG